MALNSNDRVTSNRLNYFATRFWSKIKQLVRKRFKYSNQLTFHVFNTELDQGWGRIGNIHGASGFVKVIGELYYGGDMYSPDPVNIIRFQVLVNFSAETATFYASSDKSVDISNHLRLFEIPGTNEWSFEFNSPIDTISHVYYTAEGDTDDSWWCDESAGWFPTEYDEVPESWIVHPIELDFAEGGSTYSNGAKSIHQPRIDTTSNVDCWFADEGVIKHGTMAPDGSITNASTVISHTSSGAVFNGATLSTNLAKSSNRLEPMMIDNSTTAGEWVRVGYLKCDAYSYLNVGATFEIEYYNRASVEAPKRAILTFGMRTNNSASQVLGCWCKVESSKNFSNYVSFKAIAGITDESSTKMANVYLYVKFTRAQTYYYDRVTFTQISEMDETTNRFVFTGDNRRTTNPVWTYNATAVWDYDIDGISNKASKMTQGYGSATQPIYIKSDGTPAVCTSGGISVENATNAEFASNAKSGSNLESQLNNFVTLDGTQTVTGVKTFTSTISGDISGTSNEAVYASNAKSGSTLASQIDDMVTKSGQQTISGAKTFSATITGNISGNAATATDAKNSTFTINSSGSGTGNCVVGGGSGSLVLSSNAVSGKGIWLQAHGTETSGKWALVADTNNNVTLNGNASTASNVAWSGVTSKPNLHTGFQNTTNSGTLSNGGTFVTLSAYSNADTATPAFTSTTYTLPTCHNNFTAATGTPTTLSPGQSFIALTGITGSTTASPTFVTTSYTLPGNCAVVFDYVGSDLNTIYCL